MFIFDILKTLAAPVTSLVTGWQERKTIETKAKVSRLEKVIDGEMSWDQLMAEGSQESWKDEFWTILLAVPLVLVMIDALFFGGTVITPGLILGFEALDGLPDWYKAALGIAIASAFGWRKFTQAMAGRRVVKGAPSDRPE